MTHPVCTEALESIFDHSSFGYALVADLDEKSPRPIYYPLVFQHSHKIHSIYRLSCCYLHFPCTEANAMAFMKCLLQFCDS